MANCKDCLECTKFIGEKEVIFFCDVDEDISDEKFEKEHECENYKKDD